MLIGSSSPRSALCAALVTLATVGGAIGCGGGGADSPDDVDSLVGKEAPALHVISVGGDGPSSLKEARGQVTIVDFWATFCDPCRKTFPKYQELVDKHAGDVVVIAVSVDEADDVGTEEILAFAEELSVSFPIVWDKEHKTAEEYNPAKMPTSYIIDKDGVVRHIHVGYSSGEAEEIAAEVDALLR